MPNRSAVWIEAFAAWIRAFPLCRTFPSRAIRTTARSVVGRSTVLSVHFQPAVYQVHEIRTFHLTRPFDFPCDIVPGPCQQVAPRTLFRIVAGRPARRLEVTERIGFAEQPVGPFDSGEAGCEKCQRFPFQSFGPEADFFGRNRFPLPARAGPRSAARTAICRVNKGPRPGTRPKPLSGTSVSGFLPSPLRPRAANGCSGSPFFRGFVSRRIACFRVAATRGEDTRQGAPRRVSRSSGSVRYASGRRTPAIFVSSSAVSRSTLCLSLRRLCSS